MAEYINLPSVPAGTTEAQLQTMYSYLYQMAQAMNTNLDQIGNGILTDEEAALMAQLNANQRKSQTDEVMPEGYDWKGQETLKSLIIKTAEFVKTVTDNYRLVLFGETEASSQFGDYRRKQGLKVDVTPDGIEQTYSFAEIIKGLKTYEVNAKNYIKTGLLRTVQAIPVYGVAIGKDVVTFSEDGTETYNDSNKVAELTADELSFYHNNVKTASYKGNEICFYINNTAKVKIDSTGITFLNGTTKLAELLNDSLKFYYAGTLRSQMDSSGISLVNGTTKLAEFLSTALKFYYNGTLRTEMDNDGVKLKDGSTTLAEFLSTALKFYYNGTLRTQMDNDGITLKDGSTKLAEFLSTALKFYYNGTLRTEIDSDGVKLKDGNTTLAEFLSTALKFYYNGTLRTQIDSNGVTLHNGTSTKLAEFLVSALKFYYNGTLRTQIDSDGVKLMDGNTTLAEFLSTALKFYYNGTLRTQIDSAGVTLKDGSTKLAEFAGTGLNFYYNGALRAKMNSDGVSMVKGATTLAEFTDAALKFYYNGTLRSQMDNDGFSIYNGADLMAKFQANRIGFYSNGTEIMWLSGNKMLANNGFQIDVGEYGIAKIGNVDVGFYGIETHTNGYYHSINLGMNDDEIEIATGIDDSRYIRSNWRIKSPYGDLIPQTINQDRNSNIGSSTYIGGLRPNSIYCNNIHYDYAYQDSAREIKHNIRDMEPVGDKLDRLRPVTFVYNNDKKERDRAGMIYEEAIEVMPEICSGDEKEKAINYVELVPMLLKEIQGLRKRVSELEARNGQE